MCGLRTEDRPVYSKPPSGLKAPDVGKIVRLDPERLCRSCGRFLDVAKVVRLSDSAYDYVCLGCAVRTDAPVPTTPDPAKETPE